MFSGFKLIANVLHEDHQYVVTSTAAPSNSSKWSVTGRYANHYMMSYVKDISTVCILMGNPRDVEEWDKLLNFRNALLYVQYNKGFNILTAQMTSWEILRNMTVNTLTESALLEFHNALHDNTELADRAAIDMIIKYPHLSRDRICMGPFGGYWVKGSDLLILTIQSDVEKQNVLFGGNRDPVLIATPYEYANAYATNKMARLLSL